MDSDDRKRAYAHNVEGASPERWQPLEKHLNDVADRASRFAGAFESAEWGRLAGLWHERRSP